MAIMEEKHIVDGYGNHYTLDGKTLVWGAHTIHNRVMEGCEIIGNGAFDDHEEMEDIFLPDSVKEIGKFAFSCCFSLKSILFPNGLKKIGPSAFVSCNIKSFDIPESVTSLGDEAFGFCNNLEAFTGKFATPDGRYYMDDDGFGMTDDEEVALYGTIDRSGRIVEKMHYKPQTLRC